jgi:hypothetical protein
MPNIPSLENLCYEINRMVAPARIRAIELILHSFGDFQAVHKYFFSPRRTRRNTKYDSSAD